MTNKKLHIITFGNLKNGIHKFKYTLEKEFFVSFPALECEQGEIKVDLELNKKDRMLTLNFNFSGYMELTCDRCLDKYNEPIEGEKVLYVKLKSGILQQEEEDDNVILFPDKKNEIDIHQYLYEYISLMLPMRKIHPNGKDGEPLCNPEMMQRLEEINNSNIEEEDIDPRWAALKQLKDKIIE